MEYIRLKFGPREYVADSISEDYKGIDLIADFFTTEVRDSASYWYNWILDENDDEGSGNLALLEKEDGYVYISNLYEDEVRRLKIAPQNLLNLLREWRENVWLSKPHYVKFIYENGVYTMKSSDNDDIV